MAEETRREAIYEIRIEQGPALRELEQTKKRLDENTFAKKALVKETTLLLTKQQALVTTIKNEGVATEAQARLLRRYEAALAENNRKVTEADALHARLSGVYREQRNDVSGLTDAHLRFRDKMADANLEALKQSGILGQIGAQERNLKEELKGVNAGLEKNQASLNELNIAWKKGEVAEDEYKRQLDAINRELDEGKGKNAALSKELDTVTRRSEKLEEELRQLNLAFKAGQIDQRQYQEGLKRIDDSTKSLGQKFDRFVSGQGAELKSTLSSIALQYVGVGAAIYGVQRALGSTIDTIVDFDQELANVRALGGEFKKDIDRIGQAAIELGPKFGVAPVEALKAFEALAKAGVSAADILSGGLEGALQLSAAGLLPVAEAAEIASASMNQFGLAGEDVTHIADLLAAGANKAAGEVTDFGNALKFVGPVAAANNVALEETVGAIALFAQSGVIGEQAGTSLRGVLSSLTSPSKAATAEMQKLGIITEDGASRLFDAQGKFRGLANLAEVLKEATGDLTDEQRDFSLGMIFGNQQLTAANILVKNGAQGVESYTKAVNEAGFASDVAGEKLNSIAGDIDKAGASWDAFVLSLDKGDSVIGGIVRGSLRFLSEALLGLAGLKADETVKDIADRSDDFAKRVTSNLRSLGDAFTTIQTGGAVSDALRARLDRESALVRSAAEAAVQDAEEFARRRIFFQNQIADAAEKGNVKERAFAIARLQLFDELVAKGRKAAEDEIKASETIAGTRARLTAELEKEKEAFEHLNAMDARGAQGSKERIRALEAEIAALDVRTTTLGKGVEGNEAEGKSLADLKEELKNAKKDRDNLTASDSEGLKLANANIDALNKEINSLQGKTTATEKQTEAQREQTKVLADLKKAEDERTRSADVEAETIVQRAAEPVVQAQQQDQLAATLSKMFASEANDRLNILLKQQDREREAFRGNGEQLKELLARQAQQRAPLLQAQQDEAIRLLIEGTEKEFDVLDKAGLSTVALQDSLGRAIANIKAQYREEELTAEEQQTADLVEIHRQRQEETFAIAAGFLSQAQQISDIAFDSRLAKMDEESQVIREQIENTSNDQLRAELENDLKANEAQKKRLEEKKKTFKAFAIGAALIDTYLNATKAYGSQLIPGDPTSLFRAIAAAAQATIAGLINVAHIKGFAKGGDIGGRVTSDWGTPIKRSNGDNVLVRTRGGSAVTLQTDEMVLSRKSRAKAEAEYGPGIWGKLGVPGYPATSNELARTFRLNSLPGRITGGHITHGTALVNISAPRPSSSDLLTGSLAAAMELMAGKPSIVRVSEINEVQATVKVQENLSAA